jgi:hypothetical protein
MFLYSTCYFASAGITTAVTGSSVVGLPDLLYRGAYWPAVFFTNGIWAILTIPLIAHLALVFPVVKAPLRRYRRLTLLLLYGFTPFLLPFYFIVEREQTRWLLVRLAVGVTLGLLLFVVACALRTLVTVRTAVERAQGRWLAVGILASIASLLASAAFLVIWGDQRQNLLLNSGNLLALGFPVALAVAILRYRLFDLDIIINRALVYGSLTVALALVYLASILILGRVFRAVLGQESDVIVVVATLGIAALFQPLRRRLQEFIDRRFYRRKYNTVRALQAFGASLRNDLDAEHLAESLVAVIDDTMQPQHISLWLPGPRRQAEDPHTPGAQHGRDPMRVL